MYRLDTTPTQTRAPQLPQTSRNTNPRVSTSTIVTHRTSVSRPPLRRTQMKDRVVQNNSQVKYKKTEAWCLCLENDWEGLDEIIVGVDEYEGMIGKDWMRLL
ncbi:hypothetical protein Tco_0600292 [Tanacetum coccineum]|uniref:Uncharacterized protein n=1 Tax=Tanacetum coccineum TaxID=301880 RepID=A0ABQ4WBE9_9ASTR